MGRPTNNPKPTQLNVRVDEGMGKDSPNFSPNFDKKSRKHARVIYETSRDLGVSVTRGDTEGMKKFILSIVNDPEIALIRNPLIGIQSTL